MGKTIDNTEMIAMGGGFIPLAKNSFDFSRLRKMVYNIHNENPKTLIHVEIKPNLDDYDGNTPYSYTVYIPKDKFKDPAMSSYSEAYVDLGD